MNPCIKGILKDPITWAIVMLAFAVVVVAIRALGYETIGDGATVGVLGLALVSALWGKARHIKAGPTGIDIDRGEGEQ